jgi:phage/plasmid-like protein (TIGR03299 family)
MATAAQAHATIEDIEAALAEGADESSSVNNDESEQPVGHKVEVVDPPKPKRKRTTKTKDAKEAPNTNAYSLKSFTERDVPWMKLGATLPKGQVKTALEAAQLGGLNFDVTLVNAGFESPDLDGKLAKAKKSKWLNVPSRRAVIRDDTGTFFSYVSKDYKPIQYREAFAFMDTVNPEYVAAGTLGGGKQGFIVVRLPDLAARNLKLRGQEDPVDLYVVLRTSHDLTRAMEVSVLPLRGKCMNALTLPSFTYGAYQRWSVKHAGKDPMSKLHEATTTITKAGKYVEAFADTARKLAEIDLTIESAQSVLKSLLPDRPKREETINRIVDAWQHSPTNGFTDNGWGLTNAVSEYFEWGRSDGVRTPASRLTGGLTGPTHRYTSHTAQLLLRRR